MVNLKKEYNQRKPISLIKPESERNTNTNIQIKCQPLSSEYEPRTQHPVYTREQYRKLNEQRVRYKDPEKFDVLPQPAPQNLNCPAVPPVYQYNNMTNKPHPDADSLLEMARIQNNQMQRAQNNITSSNQSPLNTILVILVVIFLFMVSFFSIKFGLEELQLFTLLAGILLAYYFKTKKK